MSELFLIAHKVRGQPAFDVAQRMECPICHGVGCAGLHLEDTYEGPPCGECDGEGMWWIIPTSGHRAYPYWDVPLADIDDRHELDLTGEASRYYDGFVGMTCTTWAPPPMPEGWPDHFSCNNPQTKRTLGATILETLGLRKPAEPIKRRV